MTPLMLFPPYWLYVLITSVWDLTPWWYHLVANLVFIWFFMETVHWSFKSWQSAWLDRENISTSEVVSLVLTHVVAVLQAILLSVFWIAGMLLWLYFHDKENREIIKFCNKTFPGYNLPAVNPVRKANP